MSRPQPARRPRSRDTLAACRQRGSRLKTARPVAVEMTRRGKRGKLQRQKRVFPSFLRAWKSGKKPKRRISTFPQRRRRLSRTKRKAENRLSKSNILKLQDDSSKVTFLNCLTGSTPRFDVLTDTYNCESQPTDDVKSLVSACLPVEHGTYPGILTGVEIDGIQRAPRRSHRRVTFRVQELVVSGEPIFYRSCCSEAVFPL